MVEGVVAAAGAAHREATRDAMTAHCSEEAGGTEDSVVDDHDDTERRTI
jgi:hypothetical protein